MKKKKKKKEQKPFLNEQKPDTALRGCKRFPYVGGKKLQEKRKRRKKNIIDPCRERWQRL